MENVQTIFEDEGVEMPVKGVRSKVFDPRSKTYLSPQIKKSAATEDIPQAVEIEVVRGNEEERNGADPFRRSSLLLHSPPGATEQSREMAPAVVAGSLPNMGEPVVRLVRLPEMARSRRASTPLERTQLEDDSVAVIDDTTLMQTSGEQEGGDAVLKDDASEASSTVFALGRTQKRGRGVSSWSAASASGTGDEGSVAAPEERPKKKVRGRPRTTNVIDKITARREEMERERQQEREAWEKKKMEDSNLVIPPSASLPTLELVMEDMESQPTPDLTSEMMQVVRTMETVATMARNLKGTYVNALRMAALKVHAGTNLLAHRLHEREGEIADEAVAELRKRNRALQLDKERLEREVDAAAQTRRDLEKVRRDLEEVKRRNVDLEREMQELKERCIEGGASRRSPKTVSPASPRLCVSIPSPAAGGARTAPAKSGSRSAPPPPVGGVMEEFGPSYFLLQQMEGMVTRLVGEVIGGLGVRGSLGSLAPLPTPLAEPSGGLGTAPVRPLEDYATPTEPEAPRDQGQETAQERKRRKRKKKKKKVSASASAPIPVLQVEQLRGRPQLLAEKKQGVESPSWSTVVGRKKRGNEEGNSSRKGPLPQPLPPLIRGGRGAATPLPLRREGRRAPPTAAITITAREGKYAEVMRRARESIGTEELRGLGIENMRARRGRTGAYVLEIPGKKGEREGKAEALANRMREVFAENPEVRIARPSATVRVRDLDDAVTVDEVVDAFVGKGAKRGEVRASISRSPNGMGTAWVRCPVLVADTVLEEGRIKVGWTTVRVGVAGGRPSHCFRCWKEGHVASRCKESTDRSKACYKCGREGHTAGNCRASPRCAMCAEEGVGAAHRMGGPGCMAGRRPSRIPLPRPSTPRTPLTPLAPACERERMEVDPPPLEKRTLRSARTPREPTEAAGGKPADGPG